MQPLVRSLAVASALLLGLSAPAAAQLPNQSPNYTVPRPGPTPTTGGSTTTTGGSTTTTDDVGVLPSVTEQPTTSATVGETTDTTDTAVGGGDTRRGALSRTGGDLGLQALVAAGLVAAGALVSLGARRRRRSLVA